MNLRAFIGSSSESLNIANAIKRSLHGEIDCTVWTDRFFKLSRTTIETLSTEVDNFDVGILVFGEDDALSSQGTSFSVTRDNVLFELWAVLRTAGGRQTEEFPDLKEITAFLVLVKDEPPTTPPSSNTLSFSEPPHIRSQR
jgi:hypothetical protein